MINLLLDSPCEIRVDPDIVFNVRNILKLLSDSCIIEMLCIESRALKPAIQPINTMLVFPIS